MPAFTYGAKSQKRLTVACDLVRFYQTVGRDLTAANIQWNQVMSNFEIQWKALKDRKDEDDPDVPKITKALPIIKWTEAFQDFLHRVIGARMIPLAYVVRIDPQVPGLAPTLAPNQPHSTEHGSVEGELTARASHTHALFRDDNSVVYYHLEEATRGHFKSRFPAFNIPRRSEEVATDTIFSDTPAIDSGVTMAQIFVGKRTLVTDVSPLKSQKQFVNTLEDNIRYRGAMTS